MTDNRKIIVVLGMHRSGTSAVARGLKVLGVELGNRLMPPVAGENDKGFWEDLDIYHLNVEMLEAIGKDWRSLTPVSTGDLNLLRQEGYVDRCEDLLLRKMAGTSVFGFKDPRVAQLLPLWMECLNSAACAVHYVVTLRHPLNVALSLGRRNGLDNAHGYLLWLTHMLAICDRIDGGKCIVVDYDRLLECPNSEIERLSAFLKLPLNPAELSEYKNNFLEKTMRHHDEEPADWINDVCCPPLVHELYASLFQLAQAPAGMNSQLNPEKLADWMMEAKRQTASWMLSDRLFRSLEQKSALLEERNIELHALRDYWGKEKRSMENVIVPVKDPLISKEAVVEIEKELAAIKQELDRITSGNSWKLTHPLRKARRWFTNQKIHLSRLGENIQGITGRLYRLIPKLAALLRRCVWDSRGQSDEKGQSHRSSRP